MKGRFFSVELKSKDSLKTIALGNGQHENVLIEGTIGQLQNATFTEGVVLEIIGDKGLLRINLSKEEIADPTNRGDTNRCNHYQDKQ